MDTISHEGRKLPADEAGKGDLLAEYLAADFPWYGLDDGWNGRRWLSSVCNGPCTVEHGTLGHGDRPSRRPGDPSPRRSVSVVTVPQRPRRPSGDGTGQMEATSKASAASLAGVALLADSWPWQLDRGTRAQWVDQQTTLAWELSDDLDGTDWSDLAIPVDGIPCRFRYRESVYGWVLAGELSGVYIGVYGHGASAYGLGLSKAVDLSTYATG
ncbi:hypothetical protein [Streptomyces sp. SID3343]|uniref:hypothetical protein n=1 Tax=Streptomyces sp. SID3343 TaxID=2690260 RepID=UPI001371E7E8|nr:hypothetical protein [Streptomyces sp. SID3343]MYW02096.1 hypothetical protein [Streptomyces sp. SID3343]